MDDKNFYEMFAKAQQMIKSGNVPKEVKDMANQIQQNQQSQLNQQNLHNQQIGIFRKFKTNLIKIYLLLIILQIQIILLLTITI